MAALHLLVAMALVQTVPQEEPVPPAPDPQEEAFESAPVSTGQRIIAPPTLPVPVTVIPDEVQPAPPQSYAATPSSDRRLQSLSYNPDQIVTLSVSPGFASVVELAEDERIENVVVGNSGSWQVTANKRGDRVIVKPLAGASQSNMILLTGTRRYVFMLDPYGETSFIMRFTYPQAAKAAVQLATVASGTAPTYRFRGNKALYPLAMSDDGRRTVIRWSEQSVLPAIFAMSGRKEQLVNGRMVGNDYVIEGAAPRYKFRYGKAEATATRTTPKRRR